MVRWSVSFDFAFPLLARSRIDLIPRMIHWLRPLVVYFRHLLQRRSLELDHSRLVGMYLNRTNSREPGVPTSDKSRERKDGKFAQNRQRH